MASRIDEGSITEEEEDDDITEDEDSTRKEKEDEKNAVMNLLLKATRTTNIANNSTISGGPLTTATTAAPPNTSVTPQPPTNSRLTMARPSVLMTGQNYEQISVKEILSRMRTTTKGPRQTMINTSSRDLSAAMGSGADEETKDHYEYMIEAPKSGLQNRDEVLRPLFLPTKSELETIPSTDVKKDMPPKLDPNKTYPEVRQVVYCMDQELFSRYQESQSEQQGHGSKNASKSYWGLQFDSNFECGNLFQAESIMKKGVPIGYPEEYDLYLMNDTVAPIPANPHDRNSNHSTTIPCGQWFFFKVFNTKKRWYRFHIHHFTKPNSMYGKGMLPLVMSEAAFKEKGIGWQRVGEEVQYQPSSRVPLLDLQNSRFKSTLPDKQSSNLYTLSFTFKVEYAKDNLFFAYAPPYTYSQLQNMLFVLTKNPTTKSHFQVRPLCRTIGGNRVDLVVITENSSLVKTKDAINRSNFLSGNAVDDEIDIDKNYNLKDLLPVSNIDPPPQQVPDKPAAPFRPPPLRKGGSFTASQMGGSLTATSESTKVNDTAAAIANDGPSESVKVPKFLQKLQNQMEIDKEKSKKIRLERSRKPVIIILARVHPNETNSSWICEGIIRTLLGDNPVAAEMRSFFTFFIIPMLNPDGVINGFSRNDISGFDLQDNWLNPDPVLHPTIHYIKELVKNVHKTTMIAGFFDLRGNSSKEGMFFHSFLVPSDKKLEIGSETNPAANHQSDPRRFFFAMAKRSKYVNLKNCSVKESKDQLTSAKAYFFKNLKVFLSMTVESSLFTGPKGTLHAYPHIPRNVLHDFAPHFQPVDYAKFGLQFCLAIADLYLFPPPPSSANGGAISRTSSRDGSENTRLSSIRRGLNGSFNAVSTPRAAVIPDLANILENLPDTDKPFEANVVSSARNTPRNATRTSTLTSSFIAHQMAMEHNALGKTKKIVVQIGSSYHNDQLSLPYLKQSSLADSLYGGKLKESRDMENPHEGKDNGDDSNSQESRHHKTEEVEVDCTEIEHRKDFNESIWEENDQNVSDDAYDHDPRNYFDMKELIANFGKVDENGSFLMLPDAYKNLRRGSLLGLKKFLPVNHQIQDSQESNTNDGAAKALALASLKGPPPAERNYRAGVATAGFQFIHIIGYSPNKNNNSTNSSSTAGNATSTTTAASNKIEEKISALEKRSAELSKKASMVTNSTEQTDVNKKDPIVEAGEPKKSVDRSPNRVTRVGGRKNTIINATFGTPLKPSTPGYRDDSEGEEKNSRSPSRESNKKPEIPPIQIPPIIISSEPQVGVVPDVNTKKAEEIGEPTEENGSILVFSSSVEENGEDPGIHATLSKSNSQLQTHGKKDRSGRRQSQAKASPRLSMKRPTRSTGGENSGTDDDKSVSSNSSSPRGAAPTSKPRSPRLSLLSRSVSRDEQHTDEESHPHPNAKHTNKSNRSTINKGRRGSKASHQRAVDKKTDGMHHVDAEPVVEETSEDMSSKNMSKHSSLMADSGDSEKAHEENSVELDHATHEIILPRVDIAEGTISTELEAIREETPKKTTSVGTNFEVALSLSSNEAANRNSPYPTRAPSPSQPSRPVIISDDPSVVSNPPEKSLSSPTKNNVEMVEMCVQTDEGELKSLEEAAKMQRLHAILENMFPLRISHDENHKTDESNVKEDDDGVTQDQLALEEKSPTEEIQAIENSEELQKKIEQEILQSVRKAINNAKHVGNFPFKINVDFVPVHDPNHSATTDRVSNAEKGATGQLNDVENSFPLRSLSILSSELQNVHPLVKAENAATLIESKHRTSRSILATRTHSFSEHSRATTPTGSLFVNPLLASSVSGNLKTVHSPGRTSFDLVDGTKSPGRGKSVSHSERESIEMAIAAAKEIFKEQDSGLENQVVTGNQDDLIAHRPISASKLSMPPLEGKSFDEVEAVLVSASMEEESKCQQQQQVFPENQAPPQVCVEPEVKVSEHTILIAKGLGKSDSQISLDLTELQNAASRTTTPREPPHAKQHLEDGSIEDGTALTDEEMLRLNTLNNSRNQTPRVVSSAGAGGHNKHIHFANTDKRHFFNDDEITVSSAAASDRGGLDGFVASTVAMDGSTALESLTEQVEERVIDRELPHQPHYANYHGRMIYKREFDEKEFYGNAMPKAEVEYGNWTKHTANEGFMSQRKFQSKLHEEYSMLQSLQVREQEIVEEVKKESLEELQAKFLFEMGLDYEHIFGKNGVLTKANWIQQRKSTIAKPWAGSAAGAGVGVGMNSNGGVTGATIKMGKSFIYQQDGTADNSMSTIHQHHVNLNGTYYTGFPQRSPIYDHLVSTSNQQQIVDSQAKGVGKILHQTTASTASAAMAASNLLASINVEYLNEYQQQLHAYYQHIVDELRRRNLVNTNPTTANSEQHQPNPTVSDEEIEAIAMRVFDMFHNEKSYCFVPRKFIPNSRYGTAKRQQSTNGSTLNSPRTVASSKAMSKISSTTTGNNTFFPTGTLPQSGQTSAPTPSRSPVRIPTAPADMDRIMASTSTISESVDNKKVQQDRFEQVLQLQRQKQQEEASQLSSTSSNLPSWLPHDIKNLLTDKKTIVERQDQQASSIGLSWIKPIAANVGNSFYLQNRQASLSLDDSSHATGRESNRDSNQLETDFKLEQSKSDSSYLILMEDGTEGGSHASIKRVEGIPPIHHDMKPFASLPAGFMNDLNIARKTGLDSPTTLSSMVMVGEQGMGGPSIKSSSNKQDVVVSGALKFSDSPPNTAPAYAAYRDVNPSYLSKSLESSITTAASVKKPTAKVVEIQPTDIVPFSIALPRDSKNKNGKPSRQDSIREKLLEKVKKLKFTQQQSSKAGGKEDFLSVMPGGVKAKKDEADAKLLYSAGTSLFVISNPFGPKAMGFEDPKDANVAATGGGNSNKQISSSRNNRLAQRQDNKKLTASSALTMTDALTNTFSAEDPAEDAAAFDEHQDSVAELNSGSIGDVNGIGEGSIHSASSSSKKHGNQLKRVDSEDSAYVKYGDIYKNKIRDGFDPETKPSLAKAEKVLRFAGIDDNQTINSPVSTTVTFQKPSRPNQPKPSNASNRVR